MATNTTPAISKFLAEADVTPIAMNTSSSSIFSSMNSLKTSLAGVASSLSDFSRLSANESYSETSSPTLDGQGSFSLDSSPSAFNFSLSALNSSFPSLSPSLSSPNSSFGDVDRILADLNTSLPTPLPDWFEESCLSYATPSDPSAFLHDCVCSHINLTVSEFLAWHCKPPEPPPDPAFDGIVWVSFTILFLAGLIGNGLVCYVVYAAPRMRTVTNLLIANMAAGDLLMTTLCMPLTVVYVVLLRYWPLGDALCRLVSFAQPVSVYVSAYTLIAIAADRYRAIVYPLVPRGSRRRVRAVIGLVWALAAATSVPAAVTSRTFVPPDPWYMMHQRRVCQERWEGEGRQYYTVAVLLLQFFLPVTVLTVTYGRIAMEVWGRGALLATRQDNRQIRLARARRKTIQMMVIVVVAFTVCWLPNHVLQIVYDTHPWVAEWPGFGYLYTATYWFSMASCVCNPIIYCGMNAQFRAAFSSVAGRLCVQCRRRPISRAGSSIRSRATSYTQWTLRSLRLRRSNGSAHSCHVPDMTDGEAAPLNTKAALQRSATAAALPLSLDVTCGVSSSDSPRLQRQWLALSRLKSFHSATASAVNGEQSPGRGVPTAP